MKTPILKGHARSVPLLAGVCILLTLGVTAAFVTSAGAHTGGTTGTATFTDPTGDATGPAPDITTVVVSDDPATGTITVSLTAVGYSTVSPDSAPMVKVYMNTDKNEATGSLDQGGAEYYLVAFRNQTGFWWNMRSWDGSKYTSVAASPTMSERGRGDTSTWTINKSDIGGSAGFAFFAWSSTWDASNNKTGEDFAPGGGTWTYDLSSTTPPSTTTTTPPPTTTTPTTTPPDKVTLRIGAAKTTPAQAVAGKRLTVTFPVQFQTEKQGGTVIDIATGQPKGPVTIISWSPVPSGKMVCDPSVAGKVIAHSESFKNGQARLSFVVPTTAKAKLLKVNVKITATEKDTGKTVSATRTATFRVR